MKIRFLIATSVSLFAFWPAGVWAFRFPDQPPLANLDKRNAVASVVAPTAMAPSAANEAAALLQSRVPGIKLQRDAILGSPRLIAAPRGFLTGPQGKGKALSDTAVDALPADD